MFVVRLACLFLASKIEENFISPDALISKFFEKASPEMILRKEQELLVALNFHLNIFHPHTAITTFLSHYRNQLPPNTHSTVQITSAYPL
jgi:hypothetical protein